MRNNVVADAEPGIRLSAGMNDAKEHDAKEHARLTCISNGLKSYHKRCFFGRKGQWGCGRGTRRGEMSRKGKTTETAETERQRDKETHSQRQRHRQSDRQSDAERKRRRETERGREWKRRLGLTTLAQCIVVRGTRCMRSEGGGRHENGGRRWRWRHSPQDPP